MCFLALEEAELTDGESKCFSSGIFVCLGVYLIICFCVVSIQTRRAKSSLGLYVHVCTVVGRLPKAYRAESCTTWEIFPALPLMQPWQGLATGIDPLPLCSSVHGSYSGSKPLKLT